MEAAVLMSVVVPVYRNEETLPRVVDLLVHQAKLARELHDVELEAVFVVDGSPDRSHELLQRMLPASGLRSTLVLHSRNFGSFAAVRTGLGAAEGDLFSVMAADLQEPPGLTLDFLALLVDDTHDVVVGRRAVRRDPRMSSSVFWWLFRRTVNRDVPPGGVDVFACNRRFRDELLALREANSSLIALMFWLGFRRAEVAYERLPREDGSAGGWTARRRVRYMLDSIFSFTDRPIMLLTGVGVLGCVGAVVLGVITLIARLVGGIAVPGYAGIVLTVVFFGALNLVGIGVVGAYAWRAFENTKHRPLSVIQRVWTYTGTAPGR
jgi:glycosyltransferase involved in cell wall biosynthesis